MKKILSCVIIAVLVLVALGCEKEGASVSEAAEESFTVYLITMDKIDQHWMGVRDGAEKMAEKVGVVLKWEAPDTKDAAKQANIVNNAVADGADAILLAAVSPIALNATVEQAIRTGVKMIYIDSPAGVPAVTQVSTNNYNAGVLAGKTLLSELEKAGVPSGTIGVVDTDGVTQSVVDRVGGFRSVIEAQSKYDLGLVDSTSKGDAAIAQNVATNMLNADRSIVAMFSSNEGTTVGTGNAVKEHGDRNIIAVGFDVSNRIKTLLQDGTLKAVMAQNPFTMGYLGVAQAYAALRGWGTGPDIIDSGVSVLR